MSGDDVTATDWPALLTVPQFGAYMGRSRWWAHHWVNSGRFPLSVRIIGSTRYISRAEADAWLAETSGDGAVA